jgi:hypothetical protein
MATRSAFLAACRAEIGYTEVPTNRTKYAAMAGHPNGNAWCLTFLVAMARKTGLKLPNYGAYTPTEAEAFKKIGAYGKTPRVGAFMFVYYPAKGRIAHVGVVEAVNADGSVTTIEGNSNSAGSRTGGQVVRHRRSLTNLTFGYPAYDPETPPKKTVPRSNPYPKPVLTRARPALKQGAKMTKSEVQYVQWAVAIPADKRDGIWGNGTTLAVKKWMSAHKAECGQDALGTVGLTTLNAMAKVKR